MTLVRLSVKAQRDIRRKLKVLNHAQQTGNVSKTCRYFPACQQTGESPGIPFIDGKGHWPSMEKKASQTVNPALKILNFALLPRLKKRSFTYPARCRRGRTYHLGQARISWYLHRYHNIKISPGGIYGVIKRNGLNRLPRNAKKRTVLTKRYEKQVPGHHIQVDVKFLKFKSPNGKVVKRFQYTAIDDATRIRALKIYNRHTQENAIHFIDYVINKFPFRIHTIRTDNGHEFQAKFHWHVPVYQPGREDLGIHHVYIKPPCLVCLTQVIILQ